jgi:hypothetical protein
LTSFRKHPRIVVCGWKVVLELNQVLSFISVFHRTKDPTSNLTHNIIMVIVFHFHRSLDLSLETTMHASLPSKMCVRSSNLSCMPSSHINVCIVEHMSSVCKRIAERVWYNTMHCARPRSFNVHAWEKVEYTAVKKSAENCMLFHSQP